MKKKPANGGATVPGRHKSTAKAKPATKHGAARRQTAAGGPPAASTARSPRKRSKLPASRRKHVESPALHEDVTPYRTGEGPHDAVRNIADGDTPSLPFKFIDLFCGIGGFRIAFERAGCECVFSSDWNEKAQETYHANFGERPHGDIYSVAENDIPPHDILCAGFPCQPFSIAGVSKKLSLGRKHGFEDQEQGNLLFKLADIIDRKRPEAFVLENVKNLKGHDKGNTFRIIWETLTDHLKYKVYTKVIDARGVVPQHRERIFLVGFREPRHFEFPEFPREGPKLETILDAEVPEKYTLTGLLWNYLQAYAEELRSITRSPICQALASN